MTSRTGLTQLEVAVLEAVDAEGAGPAGSFCATPGVLDRLDEAFGLGPRYGQFLVADMIAPWVRHLPLLEGGGNWGSLHGDPPADARYTEVRLSQVGRLALEAERRTVGPLPLNLIEGTLYRGGDIPPFDPALVVAALLTNAQGGGPPRTPVGTVTELEPHAGRDGPVHRLRLGAVVRSEPTALIITEPAYRVSLGELVARIQHEVEQDHRRDELANDPWFPEAMGLPPGTGPDPYVPSPAPVIDVVDETSGRWGPRVVCRLKPGTEVVDALDWLRAIPPVSVEVECVPYEELRNRFGQWDRSDLTGVEALQSLIGPPAPDGDAQLA